MTDPSKWRFNANFKMILYDATNYSRTLYSFPNYKSRELARLKDQIQKWRDPNFTPIRAQIYDGRYLNEEGMATEIGRWEQGKFIGV